MPKLAKLDKTLVFEILKHMRGDLSQKEISLKIGEKPQTYHKWEAGYKELYLSDFEKICSFKSIDLASILRKSFFITKQIHFDSRVLKDVLEISSIKIETVESILHEIEMSKSTYWRLMNEAKEIKLIDFLNFIHLGRGHLPAFLRGINFEYDFSKGRKESFDRKDLFLKYLNSEEVFLDFTSAIYFTRVQKAHGLEKKIAALADILDCEVQKVRSLIDRLVEDKIIFIKGDENLDFNAFENHVNSDRELHQTLFRRVSDRISKKYLSANDIETQISFRTAPISSNGFEQVQKLKNQFTRDLFQVILNDAPDERDCRLSMVLGLDLTKY